MAPRAPAGFSTLKRGRTYHAYLWWKEEENGKMVSQNARISLGVSTKADADKEAARQLLKRQAARWGDVAGMTVSEAADEWIANAPTRRKNLSAKSIKRYTSSLKSIKRVMGVSAVNEVGRSALFGYIETRRGERFRGKLITDASILRDFTALSQVYEGLADMNDNFDINPVRVAYPRLKRELEDSEPRTRFLSDKEENKIVAALVLRASRLSPSANRNGEADRHAYQMAEWAARLTIATGLRSTELTMLRWREIDRSNGWLHVRAETAKRGKSRDIPLSTAALAILKLMHAGARHPLKDWVFWHTAGERYTNGFNRHLDTAAADTNIDDLIWHDLRRTAGCRWLNAGASFEFVSRMLGHEDVAVTQRHYAFLQKERLKKVINSIEGELAELAGQLAKSSLIAQTITQGSAVVQYDLTRASAENAEIIEHIAD